MTVAQRGPGVGLSTTGEALLDRLRPLLATAAARPMPTMVSVTVPVPVFDPVSTYAAAGSSERSLWLQARQGLGLVAIGTAWSIASRGPSRFSDVSTAWHALLGEALVDADGMPRGTGPLLLGGFAFDPEPSTTPLWRAYEPASLTLPGLLLTATAQGAWLTLSLISKPGARGSGEAERLVRTWQAVVAASGDASDDAPADPTGRTLRLVAHRPDEPTWCDAVARLAGAVGRGRLDKAVLSRRVSLKADDLIDVPAVLRRLELSAPESTIFAVARGASTFIGATPERLVSLDRGELQTMAMAGSAMRGADVAADDELAAALLQSDKEREEHAVVVTMLREALAPVTSDLDIPPRPKVARFRHVQHLVTPVTGHLREDTDVLTLVGRLHPTPAVGGAPRELALELIADEEPDERGWYAGPLGWLDRHGEGEFVVALRSGVVAGDVATLFAGCGIVADSDPAREWQESSTKLLALGSALGRIEP